MCRGNCCVICISCFYFVLSVKCFYLKLFVLVDRFFISLVECVGRFGL
jgi:hypothetical protein